MHRLVRPFHKLQWQLSLSYILVVVVAVPILLGVALALVSLAPSLPPAQQLAQLLESSVAPQVPRPLTSQNKDALNSWLIRFVEGQHPAKSDQTQNVTQLNAQETLAVMVFDPAGRLAGSVPILPANDAANDPAKVSAFLQKIQIDPQKSRQVMQAALANVQDLAKLVTMQADGRTLVAVPIQDSQQRVSGALLVEVRGVSNIVSPLHNLLPWLPQAGSQQLATLLPYALLLILVVSVLGLLVGVFMARRITRRLQRITLAAHAWSGGDFQANVSDRSPDELGQLAQDLNHMALQVQQLMQTRQQLASLEERQRVARDLHDSVKQQAFALALLIGAAQARLSDDLVSVQTSLSKAGDLADQIRRELTTILQQLRPDALVGQRLPAALRDFVLKWSQQTGIACELLQVSEETEISTLRPEVEEALFRVAQEALANVARHSQASQVRVQLECGEEHVCLSIRDNGKGFSVAEARSKGGHGLSNMRARVEASGGTFQISGAPGETSVTGCVPFTQDISQRKHTRKREHA